MVLFLLMLFIIINYRGFFLIILKINLSFFGGNSVHYLSYLCQAQEITNFMSLKQNYKVKYDNIQ